MPRRPLITSLFSLLLFTSAQAATPSSSPVLTIPFPFGICDVHANIAYYSDESDHLSALDLATGKPLWTLDHFARPLLAFQNKLAVILPAKEKPAHARVQLLDVATGKPLFTSNLLTFPDWVPVAPSEAGDSFSASALLQSGSLTLRWEAHTEYVPGGVQPRPETVAAAKHDGTGFFSIDLKSGEAKALVAENAPPFPSPSAPQAILAALKPKIPADVLRQILLAPPPCVVGKRLYYVVAKPNGDGTIAERTLKALDLQTNALLWQVRLKPDLSRAYKMYD